MKPTRLLHLRKIAALALGLLTAGALSAWLTRTTIATFAITQWCKAEQLDCRFDITGLDLEHISISGIAISGPTEPDLMSAARLDAAIDWTAPFKPVLTQIEIDQPGFSAGYDGLHFTLDGLEKFLPDMQSSAPAPPPPRLDVRSGRLVLSTPAGKLNGRFDLHGTWPVDGEAKFSLEPAELVSGTNRISLQEGVLALSRKDARLVGRVQLSLNAMRFEDIDASGLTLAGEITDPLVPEFSWRAGLQSLARTGELRLSQVEASGVLSLSDLTGAAGLSPTERVQTIAATGQTGPVFLGGLGAGSTRFELSVRRSAADSLAIALDTAIDGASFGPVSSQQLNLSFRGETGVQLPSLSGSGTITVLHGALADAASMDGLAALAPPPFDQYGLALAAALSQGARDISTSVAYRLDAAAKSDWRLVFPQVISLRAASGASIILSPNDLTAPIAIDPAGIELAGLLSLSGGGLPRLDTDIGALRIDANGFRVRTGGVSLKPWNVAESALSAELNRLELAAGAGSLSASALGQVNFSGKVFSTTLSELRLFGGVDAVRASQGWRIQTLERGCLGLTLGKARSSGELTLGPVALSLCPNGGRLLHQENGTARGTAALGDITVPFTSRGVSGTAALVGTAIDWSAAERFVMDFSAKQLSLPMTIGGRSFGLETQTPDVAIELSRQAHLKARFGPTELSGSLMPAKATIGEMTLSGDFTPTGFTGSARTSNVRISDTSPDPFFTPLLAEFEARFARSGVTLTGPIRLASSGLAIADSRLDLDLLSLDGTAQVRLRDLVFSPRGLQPKAISDRVRDLLSNGRGTLRGQADFTITGGDIAARGEVEAENFGFDTFRVGAIDAVNGKIVFSDLLKLTTLPSQTLQIGSISPGIPLQNGTITFQVINGTEILIKLATWPFAGGRLDIIDSAWTIAGTRDVMVVQAVELDLADLIKALSLPDIKAVGTVSGAVPIEFKDGNALIRNAVLTADQKGGTIAYSGRATSAAASADERVQAAFTALQDFRFKVLEVGIDGNLIDTIVLTARLLGHNPAVYGGADFDFKIRIESKLAQLIESGKRAATTNWLTQAIIPEP